MKKFWTYYQSRENRVWRCRNLRSFCCRLLNCFLPSVSFCPIRMPASWHSAQYWTSFSLLFFFCQFTEWEEQCPVIVWRLIDLTAKEGRYFPPVLSGPLFCFMKFLAPDCLQFCNACPHPLLFFLLIYKRSLNIKDINPLSGLNLTIIFLICHLASNFLCSVPWHTEILHFFVARSIMLLLMAFLPLVACLELKLI